MMRIILSTIAFIMLATPSWGEEKGISIKDIIDGFKNTLWSLYELKITLELVVFILMYAIFFILVFSCLFLIYWILDKIYSFIIEKIKPKDNSSYTYKIFFKVIRVFIFIFMFLIFFLCYVVFFLSLLFIFLIVFDYTGLDL